MKSAFHTRLTFETARAILFLERKAPALRRAVKNWTARSLLAKKSHNLRTTSKKTNERRALAKPKAEEQLSARQRPINNDVPESASVPDTDDLAIFLWYKRR